MALHNGGDCFRSDSLTLNLPAVLEDLHEGFYCFVFDRFGIIPSESGVGTEEAAPELAENGLSYSSGAVYRTLLLTALKDHSPLLALSPEQEREISLTLQKELSCVRPRSGQTALVPAHCTTVASCGAAPPPLLPAIWLRW